MFFISQPQQYKSNHKNTIIKADKKEAVKKNIYVIGHANNTLYKFKKCHYAHCILAWHLLKQVRIIACPLY